MPTFLSMKIFVSSVMNDFGPYREAAFSAIRSLDHEVVRAEDFPASTNSSRIACLQGVRDADLVILILGERYGWSGTASGLSPTHEEFREAREQGKVIPFVQTGVAREPEQEAFIAEVENYDSGMQRGRQFNTPDQLREEITRAIARHQLIAASAPMDVATMLNLAVELIPAEDRRYVSSKGTMLHLAVVGGPRQTVLRPSEIEAKETTDRLVTHLMDARSGYFSYRLRTEPRFDSGALIIAQEDGASFRMDEAGSLLLTVPVEKASGYLGALIEEHVVTAMQKALSFANQALDVFDSTQKLTRVVLVAGLESDNIGEWRSLAEHQASPNSMQMAMHSQERRPVHLTPPDRTRMALKADQSRLADDLVTLLRRHFR